MTIVPKNWLVDYTPAFTVGEGGEVAKVDGVPVWASSNEEAFTVAAAADGLTAVVTSTGVSGVAQISCRADARDGAEEVFIVGLADVECVGEPEATLVTLTAGEPRPPEGEVPAVRSRKATRYGSRR